MESRLYFLDFKTDLISFTSDKLHLEHEEGRDVSRACVVFPGKRPSVYLKRYLAQSRGKAFFSPAIFSIEEFVEKLFLDLYPLYRKVAPLDTAFIIFDILRNRSFKHFLWHQKLEFDQFFLWAKKINGFLEELDKEAVPRKKLLDVEKNAEIGLDVPPYINDLLVNIAQIRDDFHQRLTDDKLYTSGFCHLKVSEAKTRIGLDGFDTFYFVGFFALTLSEKIILKQIMENKKSSFITQQDFGDPYSILNDLEKYFSPIPSEHVQPQERTAVKIKVYEGFDAHSQVTKAAEILNAAGDLEAEQTCIVVPRQENLVPLLFGAAPILRDGYNISLGYPLSRTPLFALIESVFTAQENAKKPGTYYARDYLRILMHPYVKNVGRKIWEATVTRILIHKIEEYLLGMNQDRKQAEKITFLDCREVEDNPQVFEEAAAVISSLFSWDKEETSRNLRKTLEIIHNTFFRAFENIADISDLVTKIESMVSFVFEESFVSEHFFSANVFAKFTDIIGDMKSSLYKDRITLTSRESFFNLLRFYCDFETIPFKGSPLKGIQILGLLETRNLVFKNVVVCDVNEGVLPQIFEPDPLIPKGIIASLGLFSLSKREEIFRYHFFRLVKSAQTAHLLYKNSPEERGLRSRFIEEILWEKEQEIGKILSEDDPGQFLEKITIPLEIVNKPFCVEKNSKTLDILKRTVFSYSKIDTYIKCPARFYFKYILNLEPKEELEEDIESRHIGNFFHELLREFFLPFVNKNLRINASTEKSFLKKKKEVFNRYFRHPSPDSFLLEKLVDRKIRTFIETEKKRGPGIKVLHLEKELPDEGDIFLDTDSGKVKLKGIVDRIDERKNGSSKGIFITDYKTGNVDKKIYRLSARSLESREEILENIKSFQLPFYVYLCSQHLKSPFSGINACFYCLKNLDEADQREIFLFSPKDDPQSIMQDFFIPALQNILSEILNSGTDFSRDDRDARYCSYCPYSSLCKR